MSTANQKKEQRLNGALAAACSHPVRVQCLAILGERVASPNQIARELKANVQNISYHIKTLAASGLIEEVRQRPVRGATEHFFRAVHQPVVTGQQETELAPDERLTLAETTVALYSADAAHALEIGTLLKRTDHHLTRHALVVDSEGWREATEVFMEAYERISQIKVDSAERMAESDEKPTRILSYLSLFEMPAEQVKKLAPRFP